MGDGGLVAAQRPEIAGQVRLLREYGWRERYTSAVPGGNSRLDELQAAILRVKLRHLAADNGRRRALAAQYDAGLAGLPLGLPRVRPGAEHVYHLYVVRSARRDALQAGLRERGVGSLIHYAVPVHLQPAYRGRLGEPGSFPEAERAAQEVLSLPMYPELTDAPAAVVVAAVREAVR